MKEPKQYLIEWLNKYTGLNIQSIYDISKEVDKRYSELLKLQQNYSNNKIDLRDVYKLANNYNESQFIEIMKHLEK